MNGGLRKAGEYVDFDVGDTASIHPLMERTWEIDTNDQDSRRAGG